jgi:aspartyl-tRNA(Asn)/glutamyl-tRNA(Gln) amidotransferase subunit B
MADRNDTGYAATIGIECHVQLRTKTKLFSAVGNDARAAQPNTLISHIDTGMPGALPVLNEQAVELAMRAAFALKTRPQPFSKFDRKHYFYPDLPKGYQITQFEEPVILGGGVDINIGGEKRTIRITRAHLEEDAGKSSHPPGADYSLVDLNRAGTPLLEIVSEPDMHSPEEAKAFAHELYLLMRYAGVSDADLYHGNMRYDVNVSVSKHSGQMGTRTETKNLNSFRSVEKAVEYEIKRQIDLLENGKAVTQETRGWDDAKQRTFPQRTKEDAHDYRYFPEPDIPPVVLSRERIEAASKDMPVMPDDLREKLGTLRLDESAIETLVEAMPAGRFMLDIIGEADDEAARRIANWLTTDVQRQVADGSLSWDSAKLESDSLIKLSKMVAAGQLSSTAAKQILIDMVITGGEPQDLARSKNLLQVSDKSAVAEIVSGVINTNPKAAEDVRNGEMKAIGFLVGQVMKASRGQANPELAQRLIRQQLGL